MKPQTKFEEWLETVNSECKKIHEEQFDNIPYKTLTYKKGSKYAKILRGTSVWGFVAMRDDPSKNERVGDLLLPASWRAPAKHARGNIFDGTARYNKYGPDYLI